jgi:hypothetical protein
MILTAIYVVTLGWALGAMGTLAWILGTVPSEEIKQIMDEEPKIGVGFVLLAALLFWPWAVMGHMPKWTKRK